jgi:RNA polymerase sigma-70 factor (ECF subfamily)
MTTPRTDEDHLMDLMVRYQDGEMEAFAEVYAALSSPIKRYVWTFVRNPTIAEDLVQDTFLQVHRARHTYTPGRPVRPWVYAISRHVALMHLRSTRRRKESLADEELPELPVPAEMEGFADRATLASLLAKLPDASREVVTMHHLLGLSFQEIGDILGIAPGTAKVRSHRAINNLKKAAAESVSTPSGAAGDAGS